MYEVGVGNGVCVYLPAKLSHDVSAQDDDRRDRLDLVDSEGPGQQ